MEDKKLDELTTAIIENLIEDDNLNIDNLSFNYSSGIDFITFNTSTSSVTGTITISNNSNDVLYYDGSNWVTLDHSISYSDPYAELEQIRLDTEADEQLRNEHPSLQDAYEEYELIKKLVQDEECDKYFHNKIKVFKI